MWFLGSVAVPLFDKRWRYHAYKYSNFKYFNNVTIRAYRKSHFWKSLYFFQLIHKTIIWARNQLYKNPNITKLWNSYRLWQRLCFKIVQNGALIFLPGGPPPPPPLLLLPSLAECRINFRLALTAAPISVSKVMVRTSSLTAIVTEDDGISFSPSSLKVCCSRRRAPSSNVTVVTTNLNRMTKLAT